MIDALKRRVMNMLARAIIETSRDDEGVQLVQVSVLEGELHDDVERAQPYGLTSRPLPGAEAMILAMGGTRSHGLIIDLGDRRYRLRSMQEGEVALYDDQGQIIYLTRDGIRITTPFKIDIEAEGAVSITAQSADVIADAVNLGGTGGAAVARVGDSVAGGVITSGSAKVMAA